MVEKTSAAEKLKDAVAVGGVFDARKLGLEDTEIEESLISDLLLGLARKGGRPVVVTPAGLAIRGATISGRVALDKLVGPDGGPICPIEFEDCIFRGGFSGAHAHFSRLSFVRSSFDTPPDWVEPGSDRPIPTILLSGARIDTDLNMEAIHPDRAGGLLWIRATGLRVAGTVHLSRSRLRAPARSTDRFPDQAAEEALNLMLAQIEGELTFLNADVYRGIFSLAGARIGGDVWLSGAKIRNPRGKALFLQSARIGGFLMMNECPEFARKKGLLRQFRCIGEMKLEAAEIGCSLYLRGAEVRGNLAAAHLSVRDDAFFGAKLRGSIDLTGCRIGGSLDFSGLDRGGSTEFLTLRNGSIGHALRLMSATQSCTPIEGEIDLRYLSCTLLDDAGGRLWGPRAHIRMNHFVYQQATWLPEAEPKRKRRRRRGHLAQGIYKTIVGVGWSGIWRAFPKLSANLYWKPWQVRQNWLYQQFEAALDLPIPSNHKITEVEYYPQPFEQAIRVARAEGREDFAIEFEILRDRIEWRHFMRRTRWSLAPIGIGVAAGLLVFQGGSLWPTAAALLITWLLMAQVSSTRDVVDKYLSRAPSSVRSALTEILFYVPAFLLYIGDGWYSHPFYFLVSFQVYVGIRFSAVFAHFIVRECFGYLRRPPRAIATLIGAFLIGWGGVHVANERHMLVVAAEPVAPLVGTHGEAPPGTDPLLMGSLSTVGPARFIRDISCYHEISEPLYALDVLVPIVDLGEEARCEVRRVAEGNHPVLLPGEMPGSAILRSLDLPLDDNRFWWWMKALYAIAGWFIVSLSILTFAQANKTRAEPPTERK